MRRRTLLRQGGVLAALGLAGCTGGDEPTATATDAPDTRTSTPTDGETTPSPDATDTPSPAPTETAEGSPTASQTPTATPPPTPTPDQSVTVGPGGQLSFSPESFQIDVGATVLWTWEAGGHNVKPSSVPDGSDWAGTPGEEFDTFGSGHTYAYTFEVAGSYNYYCAPHRSAGMTGTFTVG